MRALFLKLYENYRNLYRLNSDPSVVLKYPEMPFSIYTSSISTIHMHAMYIAVLVKLYSPLLYNIIIYALYTN